MSRRCFKLCARRLLSIRALTARERERFLQHLPVADVVGEDQDEAGVQRCALLVGQAAMRFDQHPVGLVRVGQSGVGFEGRVHVSSFFTQAPAYHAADRSGRFHNSGTPSRRAASPEASEEAQ
jgi:hypothetical protein